MKGWQIFIHSVRMVFSNLEVALKISIVPYAIHIAVQLYNTINYGDALAQAAAGDAMSLFESGGTAPIFFGGLISMLVTLWLVVAWHRFVLLEEYPVGLAPAFHSGPIFGYLGKSILTGLIIGGVSIVLVLALGFLIGQFVVPVLIAAGSYIFYRLSPWIVSSALGSPIPLSNAWRATAASFGTIAILVVLVLIGSFVTSLPSTMSDNPSSILNLTYSLVVGWFGMLIGASVLTTFYGHYIEGRSID